jgi:uncharacterized protein YjdB
MRRIRFRARRALAAAAVGGIGSLAGCSGDDATILLPNEILSVSPTQLTFAVSDTAVVRASSTDRAGRRVRTRFTFQSASPSVASVRATSDSTAVVTAVGVGLGAVTVVSTGGNTITLPVTVRAR